LRILLTQEIYDTDYRAFTKMKEKQKGFIPVMLTPYTEEGKIDFKGLSSLTEFYLASGASGLFANCQSSEMFELTANESLQLIEHVVRTVNGRVPVVAASSISGAIDKQADFVKRIYDLGVEAVIMITGLIAEKEESDALFDKKVSELFSLTGQIPLGFYECPEPYKRVLTAQQLARYVKTGRVIYHKDTCLDIQQVRAKIGGTRGANFGLYDAYMGHAVASLKAGAAGLSCIQGNYFPELIVWLCEHFENDNLQEEVEMVQGFLVQNMDVMHAVYPIVSKYFLKKRGLDISLFSRRKVGVFDNDVKATIDKLYIDYTLLVNRLDLPSELKIKEK